MCYTLHDQNGFNYLYVNTRKSNHISGHVIMDDGISTGVDFSGSTCIRNCSRAAKHWWQLNTEMSQLTFYLLPYFSFQPFFCLFIFLLFPSLFGSSLVLQ